MVFGCENGRESTNAIITDALITLLDNPEITSVQRREYKRTRRDDGARAGHCDSRVAASIAPRNCPGGKGWIGGGAQASSLSYRRFDARAEEEKRISLPVVVEVPVGVEREYEYVRVCIAVCFRECIYRVYVSLRKVREKYVRH